MRGYSEIVEWLYSVKPDINISIENNKIFNDKNIGQIKDEIIFVIEDILEENKLFKK